MVSDDFTLLLFLIALGVAAVSVFRFRQRAILPLALAVGVMLAVFIWRAIEQNAPHVADYARYIASEPLLWLVLLVSVAAQSWLAPRSGTAKTGAPAEPASAADVAVLGQAVTEALAAQQRQISEIAAQIGQSAHRSGANGESHVPF